MWHPPPPSPQMHDNPIHPVQMACLKLTVEYQPPIILAIIPSPSPSSLPLSLLEPQHEIQSRELSPCIYSRMQARHANIPWHHPLHPPGWSQPSLLLKPSPDVCPRTTRIFFLILLLYTYRTPCTQCCPLQQVSPRALASPNLCVHVQTSPTN